MPNLAIKSNPKLWEKCKKKACTQGNLCLHSARKMQWAVKCYKKQGGKYKGSKSSNNSLVKWGNEKWRTYNNKKSNGKLRYLPSKAWSKLSKNQIEMTNKEKLKGYKKGLQYVKNPKDVVSISRQYRSRNSNSKYKSKSKRYKSPKTRNKSPKTRNKSPKTRNKSPKTRNKSPRTRNKSPKTRNKSPRTRKY